MLFSQSSWHGAATTGVNAKGHTAAGGEVCSPAKHACLGRDTCARESQDWFPRGQNHGWHRCQQQPLRSSRIFPLPVYRSDPGYGTAATEPRLFSPGPAKQSWGSGQSPSSAQHPSTGVEVKHCETQPVTLLSVGHLQT